MELSVSHSSAEVEAQYESAWSEWQSSEDASVWDDTTGDGLA